MSDPMGQNIASVCAGRACMIRSNDGSSRVELGRRLGAWGALGCLLGLGILALGSGHGTLAAPGSWEPVASMTVGRFSHAAALGSDGRIYAIGGGTNPPGGYNTVEAYNPSTNTWAPVAPVPTPRSGLAATAGRDGRIYAIGGGGGTPLATVEVYDPRTNTWAPVTPMSAARAGLAAATGADGRIYALGGFGFGGQLTTVEVYDPTKSAEGWKTVAPMPTGRRDLAAAAGADGRIYAIGGNNGLTTVDAYDPTTNTWAAMAPMGTGRRLLGAATGRDGRIYAAGGSSSDNFSGFSTVEAYTPGPTGTAGSWESVASMGTVRDNMAAATGSDGRIYAIGGNPGLNTAEAYSPAGSTPPSSTTSTSSTTTTSTTAPPPQGNGTVREYPLSRRSSSDLRRPYGITAGPDGNLWFTEQVANKIGRLCRGPDYAEDRGDGLRLTCSGGMGVRRNSA